MRSALARSVVLITGVTVLVAGCWRDPLSFVDRPRPGAPAYWESAIPAEGVAPRARDAGIEDASIDVEGSTAGAALSSGLVN